MNSDLYLARHKQSGTPDHIIAAKLGITIDEVNRRWQEILATSDAIKTNGYLNLSAQFNMLAEQYQLVGSSLKFIAGAISNAYTPSELHKVIEECPKDKSLVEHLLSACIILKPYVVVLDPEKDLQESRQASHN